MSRGCGRLPVVSPLQGLAPSLGALRLATSLVARLRGLLGGSPRPGVIVLAPCRDVHTFGMRRPIDLAFVNGEGLVVEAHRSVGPGRRLRCRSARAVIERFSCRDPWLREGDRIGLAVTPGCRVDERRGS